MPALKLAPVSAFLAIITGAFGGPAPSDAPAAASNPIPPSLWETYPELVVGVVAVLLLQSALIAALLVERRRRKRAEATVRGIAERFRTLTEASFEGLGFTENGIILEVNDQLSRLLGYTREEMIGTPILKYVAPESQETVARAIQSGETIPYGHLALRKDGSMLPVEVCGSTVVADGRKMRVTALRDNTEHRRTEAALRESSRQIQEAQRIAHLGSYALDVKKGSWVSSQLLDEIFGITDLSFVRNVEGWIQIVHPADRSQMLHYLQDEVLGARRPFNREYRIIRLNDRAERWVLGLGELNLDAHGDPVQMIGTIQDITERKRVEEALRQSETLYRTLFESAQDSIFLMQGDLFLDCNPPTLQLFGCRRDQIIGTTPTRFSPPEQPDGRDSVESAREKIEAALSGVPQRFEWRHCRFDRTEFDAEVTLNRMQLGEEPMILAIVRDITTRKQAEQRLQHSHAQLRSLSSRLQSLQEEERTRIAREIHDHLGQLLTALKLDLRSLERRISHLPDAELRTGLNATIASARDLTDESIKSVQKIASELRPGILDRLGLAPAIETEAQAFQSRTGIGCEWTLPKELNSIPQDHATAMFRIFQEILTNIARHAHATHVSVQLTCEADRLILQVSDNGVGIQQRDLENPKSLGILGMQERAVILGGDIEFGRNAGQGTAVTVRIPLRKRLSRHHETNPHSG